MSGRTLAEAAPRSGIAERARVDSWTLLTLHALTWLVVGCGVGLLLSVLLLFPRAGAAIEPLSYGRWVPVHLNVQLYGWCGLALTGLLFRLYVPRETAGRLAAWAVAAWSGSLLFGSVTWLAGRSSGKLFLEWVGPARVLFPAALVLLELALISGWIEQRRRDGGVAASGRSRTVRATLLAGLALVPGILFFAASPDTFPPINPHTGGATPGSLLGSSLGVVAILVFCPALLGVPLRRGRERFGRVAPVALSVHFATFLMLDHGNHSHHEPLHLVALASLIVWVPLLALHLRRYAWPVTTRRWLLSFAGWGALLVTTAVPMAFPGVLERLKFTSALVGHAHLAMAAMGTSLNMLVLAVLHADGELGRALDEPRGFVLWHAGTAVFIVSMLLLGLVEGADHRFLFRSDLTADLLLALRAGGGLLMLAAAAGWLRDATRAAFAREA